MYGYIYIFVNKINGKMYVGKHKYDKPGKDPYYITGGRAIKHAIKKYGLKNFHWDIIDYAFSEEELNQKEREWIAEYDLCHSNDGYNETEGGDGVSPNEEVKNRISRSQKKRYEEDPEARIRNSEAQKKRYEEDPEARIRNSEAQKKRYEECPELKEQASIRTTKLWEDQNYRERTTNSHKGKKQSEETINKRVEKLNEKYKDPEWKAKKDEIMREVNKRPEVRKKRSMSLKGKTPWNKGKKGVFSEETLKLKSEKAKGNKANTGYKWVNKDGEYKMIKPEEVNQYLEMGYKFGKGINYKWVNKDGEYKMIKSNELDKYLSIGYKLGTGIDYKWINKNGQSKQIKPEELEKYLEMGYKLGKKVS